MDKQLVPAQPPQLASVSATCSPRLWTLISERPSPGQRNSKAIVADIVRDPVLHAEARSLVDRLEIEAKGCGGRAIKDLLQGLFLVYQAPDLLAVEGGPTIFWGNYARALSDMPADAIRKAIDDYNRLPTSRFFPKPGELRDLAIRHARQVKSAFVIAKMAASTLPVAHTRVADLSEEQRAANKAELLEVMAGLGRRKGETEREYHNRTTAHRSTKPPPAPPEKSRHEVAEELRKEADQ